MDAHLHMHLTTGLAVLGIGTALVATTSSIGALNSIEQRQVELTTQALPLAPAFTAPSPAGLIGQQVAFHVAFVTDFLGTGAELFARELPIPLTLAGDIASGTPVPIAVNQALHDFVAVELDAGRALVGFGAEYVRFQTQFVTGLHPIQLHPIQRSGAPNAASTNRTNPTTPLGMRGAGPSGGVTQSGDNEPARPLRHRADRGSASTESAGAGKSDANKGSHDRRHARTGNQHRRG